MAWWQWLVGILLFIVSLCILIGIHEAGHLAVAKMCRVYCLDYSIGFGPKLWQKKRKPGQETTFTLRAVPLGGFVSMFGEGVEMEGRGYVAPNRSLEGTARRKRAYVYVAGVALNMVLGFLLILISNACFTHAYVSHPINLANPYQDAIVSSIVVDSSLYSAGVRDYDAIKYTYDATNNLLIIDEDVMVETKTGTYRYVCCLANSISSTRTEPSFSKNMNFILATDVLSEDQKKAGLTYAPDLNSESLSPTIPLTIPVDFTFFNATSIGEGQYSYSEDKVFTVTTNITSVTSDKAWADIGGRFKIFNRWYSFGEVFQNTWNQFCNANVAIARAIGGLFTGSTWNQIGGPVAILSETTNIFSNFGFGQYIYVWGFISVNLALFNLLPFPGLDGWALVVVAYEGITKHQINPKVKNIITFVGLVILFAFMIAVVVKDVLRLIV